MNPMLAAAVNKFTVISHKVGMLRSASTLGGDELGTATSGSSLSRISVDVDKVSADGIRNATNKALMRRRTPTVEYTVVKDHPI